MRRTPDQKRHVSWTGKRYDYTAALCALLLSLLTLVLGMLSYQGLPYQRATAALPPPVAERKLLSPDSYYWVYNALQADAQGKLRIHYTDADNPPHGRPNYWSTPPLLGLRALSAIFQVVPGDGPEVATFRAARWLNPLLLALVIPLIAVHFWWRAGPEATAFFLALLFCSPALLSDFGYAMYDHHSWQNLAVLGMLLGIISAGLGVSRARDRPSADRAARRGLLCSSLCGGAVLWLGALQGFLLYGTLTAGFGLALLLWRKELAAPEPRAFDPSYTALRKAELWRWWTFPGALLALAAYLFEYAPGPWPLRLEVNHPLYALAWALCGEGLYRLHRLLRGSGGTAQAPGQKRLDFAIFAAASLGAMAFALFIALAPPSVMVFRDATQQRIMSFVDEGLPVWRLTARAGTLPPDYLILFLCLLPLPLAWRMQSRALPLFLRLGMVGIALPLGLITVLACLQNRWTGMAYLCTCVAWLPLLSRTATGQASQDHMAATGPEWRRLLPQLVCTGIVALALLRLLPPIVQNWDRPSAPDAYANIRVESARWSFARLVESQAPEGKAIVLNSPLALVDDHLFMSGPSRAIASLYWDNLDGYKDVIAFYTATDEAAAREIVQQRGVTHVLLCTLPEALTALQIYANGSNEPSLDSIMIRLAHPTHPRVPTWLEPVDLSQAPQLSDLPIRLYRVVPGS